MRPLISLITAIARLRLTLVLSPCLAILTGCQSPSQVTSPRESVLVARRSSQASLPTPTPSYPPPRVQPARFEEEVPLPASMPEPLPQAAIKPVATEELTLADLEQMALTANP